MTTRELHLELLTGKCVVDLTGARMGYISEVRAEQQDDEWVIVEYWVGVAATLERLSVWHLGSSLLHRLGAYNMHKNYRIPWDKLDLSDPEHPRLTCAIDELEGL